MKTKTIKVELWKNSMYRNQNYRILQVTDTVEYNPGEWLNKNNIDELCKNKSWKVTVVAKRVA